MNQKNKKLKIAAAIVSLTVILSGFTIVSAGADEGTYPIIRDREGIESYSSIPAGAYRININMNGRRVLDGRVFNLNGLTYVPLKAFADWLGMFEHKVSYATSTHTLIGTNLKVSARAGDKYIVANDRYFYTGEPVLMYNGAIYVPILPLVKALNAHLEWRVGENSFYVTSGDSRLLKSGAQVYNADAVYWLARIISAEARGESIEGKMAVGNVVLNRVRSSAYPNTIYGVIFDRRYGIQFSPVANGTIYNMPTVDSIIAAKMCLEGYSLSSEILYFVNPRKAPNSWIANNRPYVFTIGNHAFFK